ncbi:hypothetical protein [Arthrobacter sp. 260]|uniref:hypothetical protein n=1 Tax=Arthrobacter sp. 260 TaxID=2735314 RepID=UPI001491CAA1|nr:hypothetical protein [Arthrobacter sp. 260]NOJ61186.1 hypothetical protein [Arthrobacter sp. 260]
MPHHHCLSFWSPFIAEQGLRAISARCAGSWVFKARIVGDYAVNGTTHPRVWSIGAGPKGDTGK